jgi:hypothetical protein
MLKQLILALAITALPLLASAQLEKVFLLGTEEQRYEQLVSDYSQSLLEATNGNITQAFEGWLDMQQAIDRYASEQNYDLNGVKVWLHVFWGPNGSIDNLGFLLRPDSRFVETAELRALLAGFIKEYRLPVQSGRNFNHYTGATFPTIAQPRG